MKDVIIPILILIALVFADYLITEFKFLIIMLKIKSCERLCKKEIKALLKEVKKNEKTIGNY